MAQSQIYEGTAEQLVEQLSKLPRARKYKIIVTTEEPGVTAEQPRMITFGMFPQLQALTEEDFASAEWRGENVEL